MKEFIDNVNEEEEKEVMESADEGEIDLREIDSKVKELAKEEMAEVKRYTVC